MTTAWLRLRSGCWIISDYCLAEAQIRLLDHCDYCLAEAREVTRGWVRLLGGSRKPPTHQEVP